MNNRSLLLPLLFLFCPQFSSRKPAPTGVNGKMRETLDE
ncbi:hypothetical protein SAMN06298226_2208 [Nitrosovibrio sp. Nv4]|nr:hypothetical protein SAMN06298226_2208 [Nitrosovibrio sp. Nv4]